VFTVTFVQTYANDAVAFVDLGCEEDELVSV
jgi:hypothetical protein